ncbi:hypothetical protein HN51_036751 [Arachis hypogaea]|uniref:Auxin-induced protein n=1 Tax=Arachis hypogaea TaxID=3818 RepID=A0A444ZYD4_ARAHY|nr:auxin-responsive protein SAUR32 [Arachis ipaensis]XP_025637461.1 auxin-responsive protein SAUR32 [Arachis hypogaea]QHO02180.1 Indole-3-acetic acid-induced protein [Arachis hypogaea]RYR19241.1 hypothetical protein Ahy_B03g063968 [Arachis hypogaea]
MNFVKKCKRVWGSNERMCCGEEEKSGSYGRLKEDKKKEKRKVKKVETSAPPHGCFCVYVGEEKQRFVMKIKHANHPLFKALLDAAETEYGYRNGPLCLPCEVDLFCEALAEIQNTSSSVGCAFHHTNKHYSSSSSSSSSTSSASVFQSPLSYHSNPTDYQLLV